MSSNEGRKRIYAYVLYILALRKRGMCSGKTVYCGDSSIYIVLTIHYYNSRVVKMMVYMQIICV